MRCCCCSWATITSGRDWRRRCVRPTAWRPKGPPCGWSWWAERSGGRQPVTGRHASNGVVINVGAIDDPVPYYAAADVFVLPTFYDPCSLSVSEAAASGLPSVTTRFNGAAELLTEGVDGSVIADPADDVELAGAIRPLLDRDVRQRMGEAARKTGLETYPGPQLRPDRVDLSANRRTETPRGVARVAGNASRDNMRICLYTNTALAESWADRKSSSTPWRGSFSPWGTSRWCWPPGAARRAPSTRLPCPIRWPGIRGSSPRYWFVSWYGRWMARLRPHAAAST